MTLRYKPFLLSGNPRSLDLRPRIVEQSVPLTAHAVDFLHQFSHTFPGTGITFGNLRIEDSFGKVHKRKPHGFFSSRLSSTSCTVCERVKESIRWVGIVWVPSSSEQAFCESPLGTSSVSAEFGIVISREVTALIVTNYNFNISGALYSP